MKLKDKSLTGSLKSFSLVDAIFTGQGFKRSGSMERTTYELTIQDSATKSAYSLKVPTTLELSACKEKQTVRIGKPFLQKHSFMEKLKPSMDIPDSIWLAAESKLAEITDYLHSRK